MRRTCALAVVAALLVPYAAHAAPVSADATGTTTATGTVVSPKTPTRKPADRRSEIDVNVDGKTKNFRTELEARQAKLDEFNAQLDALDRELELATEEYNAAIDQLAAMKEKVQVAEGDLTKAREAYDMQSDVLGTRASSMYKSGSLASIEVLLDAKSVSDFLARAKFLNTIGLADADIAESLRAQKDSMEKQVADLQSAQAQAESLEFELKARQIEIMLRIQERQQMVAAAQTDLLELLDSEAARRSVEERELLAEVLAGANRKGIVVTPYSPVETALAYHGVPYLWGGESPSGFDCSGLVLYVFKQHGVSLPHYSGSQFLLGEKVAPAALQPADVVFFGSPIHHVGIYIGGGYYIHAPRTGDFVKISKLAARNDYAGARRYDWQPRTGAIKGAVTSPSAALNGSR